MSKMTWDFSCPRGEESILGPHFIDWLNEHYPKTPMKAIPESIAREYFQSTETTENTLVWRKEVKKEKPMSKVRLATKDLEKYTGRRLRERRVDEHYEASFAQNLSTRTDQGPALIKVIHGGDVASSYGYPACTEGLVTVAFPNGDVYQWGARLPANAVTKSGVLAACVGDWARPISDERFNSTRVIETQEQLIALAEELLK
jgi:hypothetical protein